MFQHLAKFITTLLLASLLLPATTAAVDIVRVQFDYAGTTQNMDIELFRYAAPLTVANYLDYVNNGSYSDSFINLSIFDGLLSTGGYTFRPIDPATDVLRPLEEADTGLEKVIEGALSPVINEFGISNTRGTIAMNKLPRSNPDSATSEWVINLADNSSFLDELGGGFTVFGKIIDDDMATADEISTYPNNLSLGNLLGAAFTSVPVVGSGAADSSEILQENLIMIRDISPVSRPVIRITPELADFDLDIAGDSIDEGMTVTLINAGDEAMDIGAIDFSGLALPFNIINDNCSNSSLQPQSVTPSSICTIDFTFSAVTIDTFTDQISIPYTSQVSSELYSLTYNLLGVGVSSTPTIATQDEFILLPDTVINSTTVQEFTIRNEGGGVLNITGINLTPDSDVDFSISGCDIGTSLAMEGSCTLTVQFSPTTTGSSKSAVINIESDAGTLTITLGVTSTKPTLVFETLIDNLVAQVNQEAVGFIKPFNIGSGNLKLSDISITGANAEYFSQSNDCPDTKNDPALQTASIINGAFCTIFIVYKPTIAGTHTATITLNSNDPISPIVEFALTGRTAITEISVADNFYVGTAQVNGAQITRDLIITNNGEAALEIISITGLASSNFSEINNCTGINILIPGGASCTIRITFDPVTLGSATINLIIESNDTVNSVVTVSVEAFSDNDSDGVPSSIEASSPNSGDGNNDGISDDVQNDVATLIASNSNYITFISDSSLILDIPTTLVDVSLISPTPADIPENAVFKYGLFSHSIRLPVGDGVNMAILLPPNENPTSFYKYGPTADDNTPHWYEFSFDNVTGTGAKFFGEVTYAGVQKNLVIVSYIDGSRGDDDLVINGIILNDQSGLDFSNPKTKPDSSSGGSGSLSFLPFLMIFIMNIWRYTAFRQGIN